jgi:predicted amidohydrolase
MQNLKISVIQSDLVWENPAENLKNFNKKISEIKETSDIILLPEMFNTGFTMNVNDFSEDETGSTIKWMKSTAFGKKCAVGGSIIFNKNNKHYNRFYWVDKDGELRHYDKKHLFRFAKENECFQQGNNTVIIDHEGWKIKPMVCYDLRFPVWARNKYKNGKFEYDVLIYVANWPEKRKHHWKTLLMARAIENMCYVIGINRIGVDGKGNSYSGNSVVISPKGDRIAELKNSEEETVTVELSYKDLVQYREKFNVASDWDDFRLL